MSDSVDDAFARIRQEAQRRTGAVPDLSKKPVYRRPQQAKKTVRKPGRDGRPARYIRDAEPLGSILNKEISQRGWAKNIAGGWVTSYWPELVGPNIAQHTTVKMIKDKKLFIECDSTAWATNLRMMQRQILQTIAQKVGPDTIVELRIYGPTAPSWRKGPLHVKGRGPRDTYG